MAMPRRQQIKGKAKKRVSLSPLRRTNAAKAILEQGRDPPAVPHFRPRAPQHSPLRAQRASLDTLRKNALTAWASITQEEINAFMGHFVPACKAALEVQE